MAEVRHIFQAYRDKRGDDPAEDIEPAVEQLSAILQVVRADLPPYADFALFGPHGRRLLQKLSYVSHIHYPDGSWQRRELPGPPSFDLWWASFRVLRCAFLLLDLVPPEVLDNYGELIREYSQTYGPESWFIIYTADIRLRSEHFVRLRRAVGDTAPQPWSIVFKSAIADKLWWDANLHRPIMLILSKILSRAATVDDGTVQPLLTDSAKSRGHKMERRRSRSPRGRQPSGTSCGVSKKGKPICADFNSHMGCNVRGCKLLHVCSSCHKSGHSVATCRPQQQSSAPDAQSSKGKGKGKGKGKPHK